MSTSHVYRESWSPNAAAHYGGVRVAGMLFSSRFLRHKLGLYRHDHGVAGERPAPRSGLEYRSFVSSDRFPFRKCRRAEALFRREIKLIGWRLWDRCLRQRLDVTLRHCVWPRRPPTLTLQPHRSTFPATRNTLFYERPTSDADGRRSISRSRASARRMTRIGK